jgi:hypothetical protein
MPLLDRFRARAVPGVLPWELQISPTATNAFSLFEKISLYMPAFMGVLILTTQ